jgi:LytTr DNA-binding domain
LRGRGPEASPLGSVATRKRTLDKILVKGPHRVRLLPVEQISWIEADGVYVKLHTRDGGELLHRELLGTLDACLDERRFVRIHRSAIVNIDVVTELRQDAHGGYVAGTSRSCETTRKSGSDAASAIDCRPGSVSRCEWQTPFDQEMEGAARAPYSFRNSRFRILPVPVLGKLARKSTDCGHL